MVGERHVLPPKSRQTQGDEAVADGSHSYQKVRRIKDLPKRWMKELEVFFVNYHGLEGKKYKLLGCRGAAEAMNLIKKAEKAAG